MKDNIYFEPMDFETTSNASGVLKAIVVKAIYDYVSKSKTQIGLPSDAPHENFSAPFIQTLSKAGEKNLADLIVKYIDSLIEGNSMASMTFQQGMKKAGDSLSLVNVIKGYMENNVNKLFIEALLKFE